MYIYIYNFFLKLYILYIINFSHYEIQLSKIIVLKITTNLPISCVCYEHSLYGD